jgi:hypothetical protein
VSEGTTIVLVGHRAPDRFTLMRAVKRAIPGVRIAVASSMAALAPQLHNDRVLPINPILEGQFRSDSGIDLMCALFECDDLPRLMLIANFAEARGDADAAGALPGFGERDLSSERTRERLREAARVRTPSASSEA